MTPTPENQLDRLLQLDITNELLPSIGKTAWQILYLSADDPDGHLGIWCALLDDKAAARAMEHDGWDLLIGDGKPGFSQSWPEGKEITTYHRFSSGENVRPLVISRHFHGAFPKYVELDQEFRLYHDLAEDEDRGLLLAFDRSGREIEVVRVASNKVVTQLKYLRQFQAGTRFHLAVFVGIALSPNATSRNRLQRSRALSERPFFHRLPSRPPVFGPSRTLTISQ